MESSATKRRTRPAASATTPATRGDRRRKQILDAALACFLEKGLDVTTLGDIRERSGASTGSIYHLFDSKEAIAGALFLESQDALHERILEAMREAAGGEAALEGAVKGYVAWVVAEPARARFLLDAPRSRAGVHVRAELVEENRAFLAAVKAQVTELARQGVIRPLPMDVFVAVVLGPMQEWARQHLDGIAKSAPRTAARELAAAAWRAVRA